MSAMQKDKSSDTFREKRWVKQARRGNSEAFGKLVTKYQDRALMLAFDITRDWDMARDAAQESFIRAYQRIDSFREEARFSTWLYRIVVNKCTDLIRSRNRREGIPLENLDDLGAELVEEVTPAGASLDNKIMQDQLKQFLATLSLGQRTALTLRYLNDFTVREIAQMMSCSENTVRIHIFRGLGRLRERMGISKEQVK